MAVVPRKRKGGVIVYAVATSWSGGQHWETVGRNKREAEQVDRERKKQVKAGTFRPGALTDAASVETYALAWLKGRTNRAADNDAQLLEDHVLSVRSFATLRMGEVRPRHVLQLITDIRAQGKLAEKTIALALGLVRVMFRDAVIDETIQSTPYVVPRGKLTRAGKTRSPYTPAEVALLTGPKQTERDRMWATIAFYTGMRCGEVCGLRWGDFDPEPKPLAALSVERQYEGTGDDAQTKTGRKRVVPVHPALDNALLYWRMSWALWFLRKPLPTDPIVPALDGTPMTKSSAYKSWRRACKAAGVTNRSLHSTRHTFITLTLRGGAGEKTVTRITHNPKGTIIDVYNHRDWADFCAAVMCLQITPPGSPEQKCNGGGGDGADPSKSPPADDTSSDSCPAGDGEIERLIERSSLGEPEAKLLRQRAPGELVQRILDRADELRRISQPLGVDAPTSAFDGSSSRTRTVATGHSPLYLAVKADLRAQVERARAAGLLGARAPLGADQRTSGGPASASSRLAIGHPSSRGPVGEETGQSTSVVRLSPGPGNALGSVGAGVSEPAARLAQPALSLAAWSLFTEARALGLGAR